ncbi:gliding motility-associated C-terminal domain-containing protein [Sediminibacterium sp.]|uniref:T9SS type B sorting domain-containing protein n=1 Tax=Sediminibacterium sp. TaxID=1917865 RepID=UPI00273500DF|nr:gliding motility-associated C-terminal domain-containing protein [Sediminibacterium sp.]MDP3394593.1 gliding motility-associated C-terminal domain-containing protein [Sediminibacterium sp.]MDP3568428.1 gliding motility-associated C-terminal domain-containing protein [Sediminibacterium sp.]
MKKSWYILLVLVAWLISFTIQAQVYCGYDLGRADSAKANFFRAEEQKMNFAIRAQILKSRASIFSKGELQNKSTGIKSTSTSPLPATVYIPVVFHIIDENPFSITDAMVQAAVDDLNKAFAHQGAYGVDTLGADTRIQFKLAQRTPTGEKSNGINRIKSFYDTVDVDLEDAALKNQIKWDPAKYANIWVVKKINGEIQPSVFECGQWTRMAYGGYASAGGGMVVAGLVTSIIAHELGHYLSLLHTFQGTNCVNNDCTTDGDRVCDTPPDRSTQGSDCNNPENSCGTDTLSGPFTVDMRDNISNFMDYGTSCPTVFTPGQGERMRAFLAVFNGGSLLVSDGATPVCADNINALYEVTNNPFPLIGTSVEFTNRSIGASNYEWWIKNTATGAESLAATTINLTYLFSTAGTYAVKLKAFTSSGTCTSSYYTQIIVSCGTVARFSPDKRIVASKNAIYEDTVTFKNYSENADSFEWYIRNNTTGIQQLVSTAVDLKYSFPSSANYSISLRATKGSCIANSQIFSLNVTEATSDAVLDLYSVNCYNNDSIRLFFGVRNIGVDTIPAGTTVRFYDKDTLLPGRKALDSLFKLPADISGNCSATYVHYVKVDRNRQDSIYLILDEENAIQEISKTNNRTRRFLFQPTRSITPKDTTVLVNSTQSFRLNHAPDPLSSILWTSNTGSFSCTNCLTPSMKILDTTYLKVKTVTQYGCEDSATATINIFPNDLIVSDQAIFCYKNNDSVFTSTKLCLLNGYEQLTKSIKVQYFDTLKTEPSARLLYEVIIPASTAFSNGCATISHSFARKGANNIYVYMNPDLAIYEEQTNNNNISAPYKVFAIGLPITQLAIPRGDPYPLSILQLGEPVTNILWTPSFAFNCTDCLTPILKTNSSTIISAIASSQYGCIDTASIPVNAYFTSHLSLPNVFSPNGDGKNDYFYVIAGKEVTQVKLFRIMNRWGATVFNKSGTLPNSYKDGWDGTYNGKPAEAGTYIYQLMVLLSDGTTETYKGNITLLR